MKPPVECLSECFEYETTGFLRWKRRPAHHFVTKTGCAIFNTLHAGSLAGYVGVDGYPRLKFTVAGEVYNLLHHHVVWAMHKGGWPPNLLDHRNRNPLDRRIENLRAATHSQNICNTAPRRDSKTGIKGVYRRNKNSFRAAIMLNGKRTSLGDFRTLDAAAAAYRKAALELHGEFARFEK